MTGNLTGGSTGRPGGDDVVRLAELVVRTGLNLQPGQILGIATNPAQSAYVRAIAEVAYAHGALYVEPWSFDDHVKLARLWYADASTLDWVPPWIGDRLRSLAALDGAYLSLHGPQAPDLFDGIDPGRVGLDQLPRVPDSLPLVDARAYNWCVSAVPTTGWARALFPGLDDAAAFARLRDELAFALRLDGPDPAAAWDARLGALEARAAQLNELRLDALRYTGPGTALTVGLLPSSRWLGGRAQTRFGVVHATNLPTEEVFTAPDPLRADGFACATRPLIAGGGRVEGFGVEFAGGRVTRVSARRGAGVLEALIGRDDGASRLGEVALVDRSSRVGQLGTVFSDTLLDENAASHLALGNAYERSVASGADQERRNRSAVHVDFMIGSDEVDVVGLRGDGTEVPLLRGGDWQL